MRSARARRETCIGPWLPEPVLDAENGQSKPRYVETLPEGRKYFVLHGPESAPLDDAGPFKVPADQYFMMGDNRDDSLDSRVSAASRGVGFVPVENLEGRADIIFGSAAIDDPALSHWP